MQDSDDRNAMGNSIAHIEGNTLKVDDKEYAPTPGLRMLILYKKPLPQHYTSDDYSVYKATVTQTRVSAYPNKHTGSARPRSTWKWKHMLSGMAIPRDMVEEEEGDIVGASSEGYWIPPDFEPASGVSPLLSQEKLERRGRTETHSIKGME